MSRLKFYLLLFFVAIVFVNAQAQVFTLSNSKVIYKLIVDSGSVIGDSLLVRPGWARQVCLQQFLPVMRNSVCKFFGQIGQHQEKL